MILPAASTTLGVLLRQIVSICPDASSVFARNPPKKGSCHIDFRLHAQCFREFVPESRKNWLKLLRMSRIRCWLVNVYTG